MPEPKEEGTHAAQKEEHPPRRGGAVRSVVEGTAEAVRTGVSETGEVLERESTNLGTAALIGAGVAIVQPELIPGMLVGVGATMVPKLLPVVGTILRPFAKAIVKVGYEATAGVREMAADVAEQFEDMVAEAREERAARGARTTEEHGASGEEAPRRARQPHPQPA